jgi:hypothetical protein
MKNVLLFEEYTTAAQMAKMQDVAKPTKKLKDMGKYRLFKGDLYQNELLPMFQHLHGKNKRTTIDDWFERTQQDDDVFYAKVQSGELAKPDIHELWRDMTARPRSKFQHILNANHEVI